MSDDWQPIRTAPDETPVTVRTEKGASFVAAIRWGVAVDEDGEEVPAWAAEGDDYPECWSAGVCWERNEDDVRSDQPTHWKPRAA